jgi:hypothetical protein
MNAETFRMIRGNGIDIEVLEAGSGNYPVGAAPLARIGNCSAFVPGAR